MPLPEIKNISSGSSWEVIGFSSKGVPLVITYKGECSSPLRIMIIAGQHGDEPIARKAIARFVSAYEHTGARMEAHLAFLCNANPDGAAMCTRNNAANIDLNRNHQILSAVETYALHKFIRKWKPNLVIDVHTYPPRRKHLIQHNLVYCHDVFLDIPNNPSLNQRILSTNMKGMLSTIINGLNSLGYRADQYTLVRNNGRVRHSTRDILDARNCIALRYGIPTVLVEGRQPCYNETASSGLYSQEAIEAAIRLIIEWAKENFDFLANIPESLDSVVQIPIRSRCQIADGLRTMIFKELHSDIIRQVSLPGDYTPGAEVVKYVTLPKFYAIPRSLTMVIDILKRHGLSHWMTNSGLHAQTEHYLIDHTQVLEYRGRLSCKPSIKSCIEWKFLNNYALFPVTPENGRMLAVFLEPESQYGLHRFKEVNLSLQAGTPYQVLRILDAPVG